MWVKPLARTVQFYAGKITTEKFILLRQIS
jgi:hypothetical protein